jgi:hypothetical protein
MATGSVWIKKGDSTNEWFQGQPYFKHATSGWLLGSKIYEKTDATTWTLRYDGDATPPAAPTLTSTYNTSTLTWSAKITAPADADTAKVCIKVSKTAYPTNPGTQDANSPTNVQADGTPFWLYNTTAGTVSTRNLTGMVSGTKYYVSVWAADASGNWSTATNATFTFPYPPAPTKVLTTKSAYISTTDSASWRSNYGWRTDNNYVYQGGPDNFQGFWFYGTAIRSLLANAHSVTKMEIYIQRSSSSHGVAGDGNIYVGHHDLSSQPSGSPGTNRVLGEYNIVDLARGEGKWVTITSSWYDEFAAGTYKGLGSMYSTTAVTSSYYNICYGKGTSSGKLKITWTEYV